MPVAHRLSSLCCACGILLAVAEALPAAEPAGNRAPPGAMKLYLPDKPGWFRWVEPAGPATDPIAALAAEDEAWLDKRSSGASLADEIAAFTDRQADRMVEVARAGKVSADFLAWLGDQRKVGGKGRPVDLRREFLLALDWRYDDVSAACAVLDRLRRERPEAVAEMPHLAIAIAVVYDQESPLYGSRYHGIHGWKAQQFAKLVDPLEVLDHFADRSIQSALVFKPATLVWPMLVHVADLDTSPAERSWAIATRRSEAKSPEAWYPMCPYDQGKLAGKAPRLGDKPYSLENLLANGGVCGDQAHFTTRTAKAFGIPAMKCNGEGRYGGSGHCWAGSLSGVGGTPTLAFTGRYFYDNYYTGDVFDPQTGREILDRYVHLLIDAMTTNAKRGTSYLRWTEARALTRAGLALETAKPERSAQLAVLAIERNPCVADAWRLFYRHVAAQRIEAKESRRLGKLMLSTLQDHPDLTVELMDGYLTTIPSDKRKERDEFYAGLWTLYGKRPDLQIRVCRQQCDELVAAKQEPKALERALQCVVANAAEGTLILPLVEYVVDTSRAYAASNPKFNLAFLRAQMDKAAAAFPKQRGSTVSAAWTEFQQLVAKLP